MFSSPVSISASSGTSRYCAPGGGFTVRKPTSTRRAAATSGVSTRSIGQGSRQCRPGSVISVTLPNRRTTPFSAAPT